MSRIDYKPGSKTNTRIEHIKPQKLSLAEGKIEETLSYANMILCCNGDVDHDGNTHCDRKKGDRPIHFSPLDDTAMSTIGYSWRDGIIMSSDTQINEDINDVLNLNHRRLAANRSAVVRALLNEMTKKSWKEAEIEDKLNLYRTKDATGRLKAYCGIVVWFLNKRLKQLTSR